MTNKEFYIRIKSKTVPARAVVREADVVRIGSSGVPPIRAAPSHVPE